MSCTYTLNGKTYSVSEFHDVLSSMPVDELMKYLPEDAKSRVVMFSAQGSGTARFDPLSYINSVFTPKQKIVGDSGRDYDQGQREFFHNVGRDIQKKNIVNRIVDYIQKDFAKKMAIGIVDQFRGLRDLNDNGNAYMLARLSKGTAGAVEALFHHGKLSINSGVYDADRTGGFIERMGVALNGELEDVLWWIAANRAERLTEEGRENLFSEEDIASGKSLASGQTSFEYTIQTGANAGQVTRDRAEIYEDANRVFNEFNRNVMDMAEQSGLIDGSQRQYWENEFYVPFYRVSEEEGEFVGARVKNGLVRQKAFDKLKGGSDKLNSDLLHNVMMNWSHLIDASAKNRAAKASLTAAETMGVAHKARYGEKNTVWFLGEVTRKIPFGQTYEEDGIQYVSDGSAEITTIGKVEYKVDDPFVMTAITSLEYAGMNNAIMNAMSMFKHALTVGVTASPAFKIKNLIRDSVQAIATSDLGYNPIKNIKEGFAASARDSDDYVSALASGGLIRFGTMLEGKESDRVRQIIKSGSKQSLILDSEPAWQRFYDKYMEPSIAAYNELGNRSEEINRSALYSQLKARGIDHATASLMARDLMDFSMQGAFPAIRFLTQVVPFLNARLQGLYKLGRATVEDKQRMATVVGACALFSIALLLMYEDDDDWKRREDFDRDNYWWFKFAGVEVRIPKPFEVGAVASLAERTIELLRSNEMTGERFGKITSDMLLNNLSMNPIPQMVKPILEVYYNKDTFTGRPIETMGMQRLEPQMRYNAQTTMVGRAVSTATFGALSPVQFDHLVRGYFSWLGASAIRSADIASRIGTSEPTRPTIDYWKFATQGLLREAGTGSSRYVSYVYEQASALEQAYATYNRLLKDGKLSEAYQYKIDNAEKLMNYKSVAHVKKEQGKLSDEIHKIERSELSADEKRTMINQLNRKREEVAKRVSPT